MNERMEDRGSREWRLDDRSLEKVRGYLEGLVVILGELHAGGRGKDEADHLVEQLESLESPGAVWEPLRYQIGVGQGWSYMADNVREVLRRFPPVDPDDLDDESA